MALQVIVISLLVNLINYGAHGESLFPNCQAVLDGLSLDDDYLFNVARDLSPYTIHKRGLECDVAQASRIACPGVGAKPCALACRTSGCCFEDDIDVDIQCFKKHDDTCDTATGAGPHNVDCLKQWWTEIGCGLGGTHSPDNKPDLAWWQARTVAEVKADMRLFKEWADAGTAGYKEKCGAVPVDTISVRCMIATGPGPHKMDCLQQWWGELGCKPAGTHSPDNKPDLAWWQARTVDEVKSDMKLFKLWADGGYTGYKDKCYGPEWEIHESSDCMGNDWGRQEISTAEECLQHCINDYSNNGCVAVVFGYNSARGYECYPKRTCSNITPLQNYDTYTRIHGSA